jgi:hypothetical protein
MSLLPRERKGAEMLDADKTLTNGRFELPASARGVRIVPERTRAGARHVPVSVVRKGRFSRRFKSFFPERGKTA